MRQEFKKEKSGMNGWSTHPQPDQDHHPDIITGTGCRDVAVQPLPLLMFSVF